MSKDDILNFYKKIQENNNLQKRIIELYKNSKSNNNFIIDKVIPEAKKYGYNIDINNIMQFVYNNTLSDKTLEEIHGGASLKNIAISSITALLISMNPSIIANNQIDLSNNSAFQSLEYFNQVKQPYVGYNGSHDENLRHRGTYLRLADIDKNSLDPEETISFDEYTTSSEEINYRLRNNIYKNDKTNENINNMKKAFNKHKLKIDLTSYRGLTDGMFSFLFNELKLDNKTLDLIYNKDKTINHENMQKYKLYKLLENVTFRDNAFVSTTTNEFFAERWANELCHRNLSETYKKEGNLKAAEEELSKNKIFSNIQGSHLMEINIPKGTEAMFVDTMYVRTNFPRGQNELTIGSNYLYRINKIEPISMGRYKFYVDIIGR